jgi:hypothetical protein
MNADGIPDYAVWLFEGSGFIPPIVEVASGRDDTPIWSVQTGSFSFGVGFLGDLDLDGDGRPDLVVVDQQEISGIRAHAYDNGGRELYRVRQPGWVSDYPGGSRSIDSLGDIDGDGADDWAIGVRTNAYRDSGALVYSGRTGQILKTYITGSYPFEVLGLVVRRTGDLDGDGVDDLLCASEAIGGTNAGVVVAFSGRTAQEIRAWRNPFADAANGSTFGSVVATPDLDRDGVPDVLVGGSAISLQWPKSGVIVAFSGRDGGRLLQIEDGSGLGAVAEELHAPPEASPFPLVLTTMPDWNFAVGKVRVYRTSLPGVRPYGQTCPGGLPQPPAIGLRDLEASGGKGVRMHLSQAPPGVSTCFVLGLSDTTWNGTPLPFDLSFLGLPGCALYTSVEAFAARVTGTTGLDRGHAFVDVPRCYFPFTFTGGRRLYGQWLLLGPGNTWPGGLTQPLSFPVFD